MLEIFLIIFYAKKIGKVAESKGQNPKKFKIIGILSWVIMEITGVIIGVNLFPYDSGMLILFALLGAAIGALTGWLVVNNAETLEQETLDGEIVA